MRKVTSAPTGPIPPAVLEAPSLSLVVHLHHARRLSLREGSGDFSAATWWREGFSGPQRRRAVDSPGLRAQLLRLLRLAWRPAPPRLQASPPLMVNPSQRYLKFQDGGASRCGYPSMVETRRVWRSE